MQLNGNDLRAIHLEDRKRRSHLIERAATKTGAVAPVELTGAAMAACHSNALDRPNSRPKLRCKVLPAVAQIELPTARLPRLAKRQRHALPWGWRQIQTT